MSILSFSLGAMQRLQRSATVLILMLLSASANAQSRPTALAVDFTLGLGQGEGGPPTTDRGFISMGLTASVPVHTLARGTLVGALHGSLNGLWSSTDCLTDVTRPSPGCYEYPSDASLSLLGGWAHRDDQGSGVRVMLGPGVFNSSNTGLGAGLVARLDGAERLTARTSLVFWTQVHLPPSPSGSRLSVFSLGLGLRGHGRTPPGE